ncbi:MAG TPA: PEGA domain-containing protein, partial [Candidatus Acidoferrum sp.]|nr:PEGA domain-containing protein [Candidatus Acidoferrum sp.]
VAVIIFGAQKIRPVFQAARLAHNASASTQQPNQTATEPDPSQVQAAPIDLAAANPPAATDTSSSAAANLAPVPAKNSVPPAVKPAPTNNSLAPAAADYKARIEQLAAEKHLKNRLSIKGAGSTVILSGKLRPAEHSDLLRFLRNAPAGVQVVDDIQYDDSIAASAAASGKTNDDAHPAAVPGHAALHIITNVVGATAYLGANSAAARQCATPCSFSGLPPGDYNLQVMKPGFQPVQTALQLRAGDSLDQKIQLEPLAQGLFISSQPEGADVFINGDKQSGQTPVTLPLAPGKYNLVLRLSGYDAYSSQIEIRPEGQTKIETELHQKNGHVAWAQITSYPDGAEIWLDGASTGQHTPSRVEVPSGIHSIILKLDGFQSARQAIQASEGGTVTVSKILSKNR